MTHLPRMISLLLAATFALQSTVSAQELFEGVARRSFERGEQASESTEEDEIETDRDSFTPSTKVVGRGRLVIESGYSFIDNRNVPETHSLPEMVSRYGISDLFELRFGYNYEVGGAGSPVSGNVPDDLGADPDIEEESRLLYGTKLWVSEQANWMPESSIILQGYTPTSGKETATTFSYNYVFGWKLRNASVWDSAIRYSTNSFEGDHFNAWSPSTVLKVPVGERWKAHVEYFGVFTEGREKESTQHFFSSGAHYLFTSNIELGVRVGWGLNDQSPNFFSNVGGGIRF